MNGVEVPIGQRGTVQAVRDWWRTRVWTWRFTLRWRGEELLDVQGAVKGERA